MTKTTVLIALLQLKLRIWNMGKIMNYSVIKRERFNSVVDEDGAIIYDGLETTQLAYDVALVLNAGIGPDWDAVEPALDGLIVLKQVSA